MIITTKPQEKRELPKAGLTPGVCVRVYDLGENEYRGKVKHQCLVMWEIDQRYSTGDYAGKRMLVSKFYAANLWKAEDGGKMTSLRKDLEDWAGRAMSPEEVDNFNTDKLIGKNCTLALKLDTKADKEVCMIVGVHPPMGEAKMVPEIPPDYDPEWILKLVHKGVDA